MGMVAGSMGSVRPLIVKIVGHISSISHTSSSAANSGEDGSGGARRLSPWRARGAASRVQGDSVLQTQIPGETLPMTTLERKRNEEVVEGSCTLEQSSPNSCPA